MTTLKETNRDLISRLSSEPAPLLPVLHGFHDRDGYLSDEAIVSVSEGLKIPLAELFATVSFYHHFSRTPPGQAAPRVCTGPVCSNHSSLKVMAAHKNSSPMPCSGRCDTPVAVMVGHECFCGGPTGELTSAATPLPAANPGGYEECIFSGIRDPSRATLDGYREDSGYQALEQVLKDKNPADVINLLDDSGLVGRGGAGFPTGRKWKAVADAPGGPKTVVCNADEGEPGCFMNRVVLNYDPHAVIEGMLLAAYVTGATRGFIYLRYEYPDALEALEKAIQEAKARELLGARILGSDFSFELYLRRGAGAYICGEEGSLLNSLEGKHPYPRNRPPFPVTHGFENLPTVVNNVETLACVPPILRNGAKWYQDLGVNGHAGTKVISLSGDIQKKGNYEVPVGMPLKSLIYEWGGGPMPGRSIKSISMAGLSGGFLAGDDLNVTLDEPSIRAKGSFLGAGGIMVFDDRRDMVAVTKQAMQFFAEESCGKCFPCRIGTTRLAERWGGTAGPSQLDTWTDEVKDIAKVAKSISACGLGMAAAILSDSVLKYFPGEVERHVRQINRG